MRNKGVVNMKPLIKYTGGKYKEYLQIKDFFPNEINNYYEPFFGGGGVFFRLKEENKIKGDSFLSDISADLIDFYNCIGKDEFETEIWKIEKSWSEIHNIADYFCEKYADTFMNIITGNTVSGDLLNDNLKAEIVKCIDATEVLSKFNFHGFSLADRIYGCIFDKTKRFILKDIDINDDTISCKSLRTAVHQGFYFTIRDMYNEWLKDKRNYTVFERSAQWYFIREFCFGGMFRFGKDGNFNVPYGGAVYNDKVFENKTKTLATDEIKAIVNSATFKVCDFEDALNAEFKEDDFVFLDPPYDSTFSEYDNNSFTREDHKRLHDVLDKLKCKWLMAIGKTDFISGLYDKYEKIEYDKTYMYQARGTYDNKKTTHLLIKNF